MILSGLRWKTYLAYVDEAAIFFKKMQHVKDTDVVLTLLCKAEVTLELPIC